MACPGVNRGGIKQISDVVTVEFEELHFDLEFTELGLFPSVLDFFEDEVEDARYDSDLLHRQTHSAPRTHGMRLATASLTVR